MDSKIIVCLALVPALILPAVLHAETSAEMPTMEELVVYLGYSKADTEKLLAGEIISRGLEEGSEKELAVTVAMLMPVALNEMVALVREGKTLELNRDVIAFRDLGDAPADEPLFNGLGFETKEVKEVSKLLEVEPGSTFNLSSSEIERFQSVARRFKSQGSGKESAIRAAVNAEYREILMNRYGAYRGGGLGAIAPYDRGDRKRSSPGKELLAQGRSGVLMKERMPDFYRAFLNYPRDDADDIQNLFFWIKQRSEDRPTFVLAHRMYRIRPEYAIMTERQFYVGHSYNSLHVVVGCLQVKEGTLVFYGNRTSTDQVAGFGSGMKHKIGREMMRDTIVDHFKLIQRSAK